MTFRNNLMAFAFDTNASHMRLLLDIQVLICSTRGFWSRCKHNWN